jgi:hypothetical protein
MMASPLLELMISLLEEDDILRPVDLASSWPVAKVSFSSISIVALQCSAVPG